MKLIAASCANIRAVNPQPVWSEVQDERPDSLLLLGDNIYLANDRHTNPSHLGLELRQLYQAQMSDPYFAALLVDLRTRGAPILATYDDHDFLGNDRCGGDDNPALRAVARDEFKRAFMLDEHDDVYRWVHTPLVDIAVLDTRYHRHSPALSQHDRDAILGAQQWSWLETICGASRAPYLVVASSITFHHFGDECWEQYPSAFTRLRQLLHERPGTLVLSGDAHRNALYDDSGVLEIVTSGIARKSLTFGTVSQNYGVFNFTPDSLHIDLRSLKAGSRFKVTISCADWSL